MFMGYEGKVEDVDEKPRTNRTVYVYMYPVPVFTMLINPEEVPGHPRKDSKHQFQDGTPCFLSHFYNSRKNGLALYKCKYMPHNMFIF